MPSSATENSRTIIAFEDGMGGILIGFHVVSINVDTKPQQRAVRLWDHPAPRKSRLAMPRKDWMLMAISASCLRRCTMLGSNGGLRQAKGVQLDIQACLIRRGFAAYAALHLNWLSALKYFLQRLSPLAQV